MEYVTVSEHLSSLVQDSDGLTLRIGTEVGSHDGSFDGSGLLDSSNESDG